MILSWLSKLLAGILVSVLSGAIVLLVLDHTVLSSHYLQGQLTQVNAYTKLSGAISTELAKNTETDNPQMVATLRTIITPAVLQQKITSALDQLEAYYKGNGPAPQIDITDLVAKAQAAGVPVPQDSNLNKPISLGNNVAVKNIGTQIGGVQLVTVLAALLLAVLLMVVSWERHKFAVLPDILITLGLLFGVLAALLAFTPGFVDTHLKLNLDSNAFAGVGRDLAESIARDLGKRFAIIAGVSLVVGIATRIWVARLKPAPQISKLNKI
jgi:hypothetical protein